MKFGYIRVSTKEQNEARQVYALLESGISSENLFIDKASGKDFNREQYKILLKTIRENDVIVVKSLDRLGRNYDEIKNQFKAITDRGVHINILDTPILNTDQIVQGGLTMRFLSDLILSILGYVAEQEREHIKSRQAEGIASAKRLGKKFGRPSKINGDFLKISGAVKDGSLSINQACLILGISRRSFYNYINVIKD
jgi:DNA invertase Pin-like site-specific DNA recombinase